MLMAFLIHFRRLVVEREVINWHVPNIRFLDKVRTKGILLTNIMSAVNSTSLWCRRIEGGTLMRLHLTVGAFGLVVFPFRAATSGPNIVSALSMASTVTGQSWRRLFATIFLKSFREGRPTIEYTRRACLASLICRFVKF